MRNFSLVCSLACQTIAYAYLLNPPTSMLAEDFELRSEPKTSCKSRRGAFGTLPRKVLRPYQFRSTVNLLRRKDSLQDRSAIALGIVSISSPCFASDLNLVADDAQRLKNIMPSRSNHF